MKIRGEGMRYRGVYTKVPNDPSRWKKWESKGRVLMEDYRRLHGGELSPHLICREGDQEFPRLFQLLREKGTVTIEGALKGYLFTFIGKKGVSSPDEMLNRVKMKRGESVLVYYGVNQMKVDPLGLEILESVMRHGGCLVVVTYTDEQKAFIDSRLQGHIQGVVSLETIGEKQGVDFDWPPGVPYLPDPDEDWEDCNKALKRFEERTLQPFGREVRKVLSNEFFDIVFERARHDSLGISVSVAQPKTGRVVYCEEMGGLRYSFYGPLVWRDQRRVEMPTATIRGGGKDSKEDGFAKGDKQRHI